MELKLGEIFEKQTLFQATTYTDGSENTTLCHEGGGS